MSQITHPARADDHHVIKAEECQEITEETPIISGLLVAGEEEWRLHALYRPRDPSLGNFISGLCAGPGGSSSEELWLTGGASDWHAGLKPWPLWLKGAGGR